MIEIELERTEAIKLCEAVDEAIKTKQTLSVMVWGFKLILNFGKSGKITGYINDTSGG